MFKLPKINNIEKNSEEATGENILPIGEET